MMRFVGLALLAICVVPLRAVAQSEMPDTSEFGPEVTIVALDSFNFYNGHAVIVRRSDKLPHDVIVIERKHINPQLVYSALHQLDILRGLEGSKLNVPTTGEFPVPNHVNGRKFDMDFAALIAHALRNKDMEPVDVPGIGRGPVVRRRPAYKMTVTVMDSTTKKP